MSLGGRNGSSEVPDISTIPSGEDMAGLWAQYHSALGLAKGKATPPSTRDQSVSSLLFMVRRRKPYSLLLLFELIQQQILRFY